MKNISVLISRLSEGASPDFISVPCKSRQIAQKLVSELRNRWKADRFGDGIEELYEVDEDTADTFRAHSNCDYYELEIAVREADTLMGWYDAVQAAANIVDDL